MVHDVPMSRSAHAKSNMADTNTIATAIYSFISFFDDEEDDLLETAAAVFCMTRERIRVPLYVENVVTKYDDLEFRSHFRMTRRSFNLLTNLIYATDKVPLYHEQGREAIKLEKQVLVTVWYMANKDSHREIADRFNITVSSVARVKARVIDAVMALMKEFIVWPTGARLQLVQEQFLKVNGFPGVVGAIDGTHIPIAAPSQHKASYLNRKKYHSLVLQAVVDHQMGFTDVYVGWPGSVHDARIYANSSLYHKAAELFPTQSHLIGDGAYPLSKTMMTPYRDNGHLSPQQRNYNKKHASTRVVVERAFGLLKIKWRRLHHLEMFDVDAMCRVICAGCVLHNFVLAGDGPDLLPDPEVEEERDDETHGDNLNTTGHLKRDYIAGLLM